MEMVELLDVVSNVIPENQKQVFRRFYRARDNAKLVLYGLLNKKEVLPVQLKERLTELGQLSRE